MTTYTDRIPVDPAYTQALGEVVYNFATTAWMIVYLGSLVAPSFVLRESGADFDTIATEFSLLTEIGKHPEFADISARFTAATVRRKELEKSIPITASGGTQELDGSEDNKDHQWSVDEVIAFAKEVETLDIDANALYYKLKAA